MISEQEKETGAEQTPIPEEDKVKSLEAELATLKAESQRLKDILGDEKGFKSLQQRLSEKDQELKKRVDLESRIAGFEDRIELLATAIATGVQPNDESLEGKRPDVVALLKTQRQEQDARRKQEDYNRRADAIYARAKEVFDEDDDNLERVEELLMSGRLDRAEARINKADKTKTPVSTQPAESEDKRINRLVEEKLRKELENRGLLTSEVGGPSAGGGSPTEVMSLYIQGKISAEEAKKRGVKFD